MKHLFLLAILISCATTPPQDIVDIQEAIIQLDAGIIQAPPYREVFTTKSSLKWVQGAVAVSNCVINNEEFLSEVENYPKFTYTDKTPKQVAELLRSAPPAIVSTYKKSFTKAIAYRNVGSNVIYLNTAKNPRVMSAIVNTAAHELAHIAGLGHGDNSPRGKQESAPYRVGKIAERYSETCK